MGILVKEHRSNDFEQDVCVPLTSNEEHIYENLPKLSLGESEMELPESIVRTTTAESTPATQPRSIQVTPQSSRLSFSDIKISKSVSDRDTESKVSALVLSKIKSTSNVEFG